MYQAAFAFNVMIYILTANNKELLPMPENYSAPKPSVAVPGTEYKPPIDDSIVPSESAPKIYEHSGDAGPDHSFFVVGSGLTDDVFVWGRDAQMIDGRRWDAKPHLVNDSYLAVVLPERSYDSIYLVWVKNSSGWSRPIRLNLPQPWWCYPRYPVPGQEIRIFGRDLARRPDRTTAFIYLAKHGSPGRWLELVHADKYNVTAKLPDNLPAGVYQLWFHAGNGGQFGWGDPLEINLCENPETKTLTSNISDTNADLHQAIRSFAEKGGGILKLGAGTYHYQCTLKIPANVVLNGAGIGKTILQAEHCEKRTEEAELTGPITSAVWLAGDNAGITDLTISGNPQISDGVLIQSDKPLKWVNNCRIDGCRISDLEGKHGEICGVRFVRASNAIVKNNEIYGRAPLFMSGIRYSNLSNNRLYPVTRYGGNSEGAILGRTDIIEECIIENNIVCSPSGNEAGGPLARRLIWVSTGRGSVTKNWFAGNGVEQPKCPGSIIGAGPMRFGGVAGTDQNVGEMILFEANHRTMYFGPIADADKQSILLPKTIPATPDNLLGNVKREDLAYDSEGRETYFRPPDEDDGSQEPPITEYYVSVFKGPGQGQTRRVLAREGELLLLDRQWNIPPESGSIVAVGTAFYRNLIVGNYTPDGMTGIQLWISCMENIASGNSIARMRRPAFFLYANGTTLASSMPRTWNRGISPLFFNHIEGNRSVECNAGALVTSGDDARVPINFPRALGNVIRHNSYDRNRTDGVIIASRKGNPAEGDTSPSILGTIVEFNVVRDASVAYHSGNSSDGVLFRRNHAYFWYPVNNSTEPLVGFQIDVPGANVILDQNDIEGKGGEGNPINVIEVKKATK